MKTMRTVNLSSKIQLITPWTMGDLLYSNLPLVWLNMSILGKPRVRVVVNQDLAGIWLGYRETLRVHHKQYVILIEIFSFVKVFF